MRRPDRTAKVGLTFDDVLLIPRYSRVLTRKGVDTRTLFSRRIHLSVPIVSANMDTVTEAAMAIAMARLGGIGTIHRFMPAGEEVEQVSRVKRSESVLVEDPVTLGPDDTVGDAVDIIERRQIGGIVIVGKGRVVEGLVTRRDVVLEEDREKLLRRVMTHRKDLVTATRDVSPERAREILRENKVEKLPLLDRKGRLVGLITSKDITKRKQFPNATKDKKGRLMVAAAVGVKGDYLRRAEALLGAGCDALVVDIAHGHSVLAIDAVRRFKKEFGDVEVVAGNVATARGALDLARAGADSVKVGVGAGSICVTRVVTGFGVPQLSAIMDCAEALGERGVPVIGDGGIRNPGDVTKAIAGGASSVMVGSLLAGTEESPGPTILRDGLRYKVTRGMASLGASIGRRVREETTATDDELVEEVVEGSVPEGVEGLIPYKGSAGDVVRELVGGLRSGMSYCGSASIAELQRDAEFLTITSAGYRESLPHDIKRVM